MKTKLQPVTGTARRYQKQTTIDATGTVSRRSVDIGGIVYQCEITVDLEDVRHLAHRAALNKGRKARSGPVSAKLISRTETA